MTIGYELSPIQRRLVAQSNGDWEFITTSFTWKGCTTPEVFAAAIEKVLIRHELLGSSFVAAPGATMPLQVPHQQPTLVVQGERNRTHISAPAARVVSRRDGDEWLHEVALSSMVSDPGCLDLLHRDLLAQLRGTTNGDAPTDYSMMAQWMNELPDTPEGASFTEFWRQRNHDSDWFGIQREFPKPSEITRCSYRVGRDHSRALMELATQCNTGAGDLLLAAWSLVLCQSLGEPRIDVGVYIDGRNDSDLADLMGPLGIHIPISVDVVSNSTIGALLEECYSQRRAVTEYAEGYRPGLTQYPRAGFTYTAAPEPAPGDPLRFTAVSSQAELTGAQLSCVATEEGLSLEVTTSMKDSVAAQLDPELLIARVASVVDDLVAAGPDGDVSAISAIRADDPHGAIQHGPTIESAHTSMLAWFDKCARRVPNKTAIGDTHRDVTYAELDNLADRYAEAAEKLGITPGEPVLIRLPRGVNFPAALLGLWRVGAMPVPLDPHIPPERVDQIRTASGARAAISENTPIPDSARKSFRRSPAASDSAYCIYTSGSTGLPKGVVVSHGALATHCAGMGNRIGIDSRDRISVLASTGFDVCIEQNCLPWTVGATAYAYTPTLPTPEDLLEFTTQTELTILGMTPSLWRTIGPHWSEASTVAKSVRLLILGAETMHRRDIEFAAESLPHATVLNAYGPTEAVITATTDLVTSNSDGSCIGTPLPGRSVAILDLRNCPVPKGVIGQLGIWGPCLGTGYHGNESETADRFISPAWLCTNDSMARMLLTGDYASMNLDGSLNFHGRRDRQVKLRGQRIELDEVEIALSSSPNVESAAVVLTDSQELFAAVTPASIDITQLRERLSRRLPQYMLPDHIVTMNHLLTLSNGKVDYRGLIDLRDSTTVPLEAPATETERRIAAMWANILEQDEIGRDSDFFNLGGQSLKAIALTSLVRKEFTDKVKVATLFVNSRLRDFATAIDDMLASTASTEPIIAVKATQTYTYAPSHAQRRLWFLDQFIADGATYNAPLALYAPRHLTMDETEAAWQTLALHHDALRTTFQQHDGNVHAVVGQHSQVSVQMADLRHSADSESEFTRIYREELATEFDLAHGPLGHVTLFWMPDGSSRCFINLHHIVTDLWSTAVLLRDFVSCINGGHPVSAREYGYRDYAELETRLATSHAWSAHEQYLLTELTPPPEQLKLPLDFPRPDVQTYVGADQLFKIENREWARIDAVAHKHGMTPFMVFMSAYLVMLRRLTNQNDITVGFPMAGRNRPEFQDVVGFFVSTSFIRIDFRECHTPSQLIDTVKRKIVRAMEHEEYPFDLLVSKARLDRSVSHSPVFMTTLAHQDLPPLSADLVNQGWQLNELTDSTSKFDLSLTTWHDGDAGYFAVTYNSSLFKADTANSFGELFSQCLTRLLEAI